MEPTSDYKNILRELATTMLDVARESVALIKRSDQKHAIKLTQKQEWDIYLEFLKVMFNLVDRLSAFHIPLQSQPEFMNSLEDAVSERLKTVLAPRLSSAEIDDMEITLSIGQAVAESRQMYERYKFVVGDESKEKDAFFQLVGGRIAAKAGARDNAAITSAAELCARAVIPALTALFQDSARGQESPARHASSQPRSALTTPSPASQSIKLVSVFARISGEEVETRWGVPPHFQRDLKPDEANDLATHMNRVTRILGERFAILSSKANLEDPTPAGHA